jgi:hypothetical protein
MDRQPHADGRRHRLGNQMDLARPRVKRGIPNGPFFHFGNSGRNGDDHAGPKANGRALVVNFFDEVAQHRLGHFEISNDAVLHRADRQNGAGRAAQHPFGLFTHRENRPGSPLDGHHGRLAKDNPLALDVDQRIGSPQIDP